MDFGPEAHLARSHLTLPASGSASNLSSFSGSAPSPSTTRAILESLDTQSVGSLTSMTISEKKAGASDDEDDEFYDAE